MPHTHHPYFKHPVLGTLYIVLAALCWASSGLIGAYLTRSGFSGFEAAYVRVVWASVLLVPLLPWLGRYLKPRRIGRWPVLVLQSLLGVLGTSLCYFAAVAAMGSALSVALLYTAPLWSLLLARLVLHERITLSGAAFTLMAAAGVALLMGSGQTVNLRGLLFGLAAGLCYAAYGVLSKRAMQDSHPMSVFLFSFIISSMVLLCTPMQQTVWLKMQAAPDATVVVMGVALAFFGALLPYFLFMKGLAYMPPTHATVLTTAEPLTVVLVAGWWLDETLSGWQYAGIALVVGAALLNALSQRRRSATVPTAP